MKTKYILLAAVLFFSFNTTQAQHIEGDLMAGIQNTLNNSFTNSLEGTEFGRLWMLLNSDIRFVMKGPAPKGTYYEFTMPYIYIAEDVQFEDASIYGEFDWENKALSMYIKRAEKKQISLMRGLTSGNEFLGMMLFSKEDDGIIDHYQYMDMDGYWYIPDSPKANIEASSSYLKFHGQTAMMSMTRTMRGLAEIIESERDIMMRAFARATGQGLVGLSVLSNLIPRASSLSENLESIVNFILNERLSQMGNMPLFIHWAVIYSPETVQQEGNVTATRFTYRGIPNCLQLTGARGKYMIFDNYNRLVFINSGPKGGSVEYFYDRDVTVNLPAASLVSVGSPFNRN